MASPFGSHKMIMPPFETSIKSLNAMATLRLVDGKPAQPRMSPRTQQGTPLGRAPVAPFPSPDMSIKDRVPGRSIIVSVKRYPPSLTLYPRVGFIVTNLPRPAERIVAFYNQRGTAEQ